MNKSGFETLNGARFYVRRWGVDRNPPLLLLHGFPEYGGAWEALATRLSHRFHVIAPDQRGCGQSWTPPDVKAYRMHHLVQDMTALLDGTPAYVMGHDWGAAVAYGLATSQPKLVKRLIIANGVHPVPFQRALVSGGAQTDASQYIHVLRAEGSEDRLAANDFEKLLKLFSAKMDLSWMTPERLDRYRTEWHRPGRLKGMINWYRASPLVVPEAGTSAPMPDLPLDKLHVRCPHLLIWGAADTALLPEATDGLEDFAPDLTRVTLPDADHWLVHQKTEEVADILLNWLP